MAWLEKRGRKYRLSFRYDGREYHQSLGTSDVQEADACRARLEDTLNRIERGWLRPPVGADLALFLLSGGEITTPLAAPSPAPSPIRLSKLVDGFLGAQATAVEPGSLDTLGIHLRHITATLGENFTVKNLTLPDLQRHVDRRRRCRGRRGRPLAARTIRKELASFASAWKWAVLSGYVSGAFPSAGLKFPKESEQPPFQTRAEIERHIARGGLSEEEQAELWEGLFLTLPEIAELLVDVHQNATQVWVYPMVCTAAHTGARRSELLRARLADIDLEAGVLLIREKKRAKGRNTTRTVPLSPFLANVLREWLESHPGGVYLFSQAARVFRSKTKRASATPVTRDEAHDHLKRTLDVGKWRVVRGWHVLWHSFISNCAARGVDQRLIDAWVGHTTEEMRRRYRHLLPDQSAAAIRCVFEGQ